MKQPPPFAYTTNIDEIPAECSKLLEVTPEPGSVEHVVYACPDSCWVEHLEAWGAICRAGNKAAPNPMPWGHLMFERPTSYGKVRLGDTSIESRREAETAHVIGMLYGWDRDLTPVARTELIRKTVDARMQGIDLGIAPFVACLGLKAS